MYLLNLNLSLGETLLAAGVSERFLEHPGDVRRKRDAYVILLSSRPQADTLSFEICDFLMSSSIFYSEK